MTGINPGDNATYECGDGFTLVGDGTRMCIADPANERGVWSGEDPMCLSELTTLFHVQCNYVALITIYTHHYVGSPMIAMSTLTIVSP